MLKKIARARSGSSSSGGSTGRGSVVSRSDDCPTNGEDLGFRPGGRRRPNCSSKLDNLISSRDLVGVCCLACGPGGIAVLLYPTSAGDLAIRAARGSHPGDGKSFESSCSLTRDFRFLCAGETSFCPTVSKSGLHLRFTAVRFGAGDGETKTSAGRAWRSTNVGK